MLTETKQIVLANKLQYRVADIHIEFHGDQRWNTAHIVFEITSEKGERMGYETLDFNGTSFASFAKNFNSWTYLYEQLAVKLNLPAPQPNEFEDEFTRLPSPEELRALEK